MRDGTPRFGFIMEQTLGHVTHYTNLRSAVDTSPGARATWYPVTFAPEGAVERAPVLAHNWSARASWRAWRMLRRDHASERYDALFFHTQVTTLLSSRLMRQVPSVVSLDATPINYDTVGSAYGHQRSSAPMENLKRALNARSLHAARAIVTWCEWARQSLVHDYGVNGDRISVIAPGVNLDLWPRPAPRESDGTIRLLFVGGDFERKGGEVLLEAFRGLPENWEIHLVTKAPAAAAPRVHVYRDVAPNSDVLRQLYATSDIFVLPTLADCFPLVVQEAMAAGLPVVSTDIGAIGEAVRHNETGLLVPPGDVSALRSALECLGCAPTRRRALGACGREMAARYFDSSLNARRILDVLSHIAER